MFKRPHHWHLWHFALTCVLLVAVFTVGITVGVRVNDGIQNAAKQAAVQAAAGAPNLACNPKAGSGRMGICAPGQAFAVANELAIAAHDPDNITTPIGTDVSDNNGWQCNINWAAEKTANHLAFVYIKATESTTDTDPCLTHNIAGASSTHLLWGLYDFLRPGESSAVAEADHFIAVAKRYGTTGTLPPTADVEVTDGETPAQVRAYVTTWVATVAAALGRADIYSGPYFFNDEVGATLHVGYWDADWATQPLLPAEFSRWTFWQFAAGAVGPTPHINDWDADTFNGNVKQLEALAGVIAPKPKPKPKPRPPRPPAHADCFGKNANHTPACTTVIKQAGRLDGAAAMTDKRFDARGCPKLGARIASVKRVKPSKRSSTQRLAIVHQRQVWRARKCAGLSATARADRAAATKIRRTYS